jgi:hypothetical protein
LSTVLPENSHGAIIDSSPKIENLKLNAAKEKVPDSLD